MTHDFTGSLPIGNFESARILANHSPNGDKFNVSGVRIKRGTPCIRIESTLFPDVPKTAVDLRHPSLILPFSLAERVSTAKRLLAEGKVYPQGCSGFVCEVLGIPWEPANALMGDSPTNVGDNNNYSGLTPGDIAGWIADELRDMLRCSLEGRGTKFIDVRSENESPRRVGNGYGMGRPLFKSSRFWQ
jgi:hypothetical protein